MASRTGAIYTGVTNDIVRRVYQYKHGLISGFTTKYSITKLVYYESGSDINSAITREKQIKGWLRKKKVALVESTNPDWTDLSEDVPILVEIQE
jgi:putative endonuclease